MRETLITFYFMVFSACVVVCFSTPLTKNAHHKIDQVDKQYIISVDETVSLPDFISLIESSFGITIENTFNLRSALFILVNGAEYNVMKLESFQGVKYVQKNQLHSIAEAECQEHEASGCWGLDRIDQRDALSYSNPLSSNAVYTWGEHQGGSSVAYVADSGIDITHSEFEGRAIWGYNAIGNEDEDNNGHGTNVAGTIGSKSYGVAKSVQLVAVKVLSDHGMGSIAVIIEGLEWIISDHESRSSDSIMAKSIINISIGGGIDNAFDDAVAACVHAGIVVVTASGNDNADACFYSPAREPLAITAGGVNVNDKSAWFTNYGTCVDIFGPAVDIFTTAPEEDTTVVSGTSFAAPFVVGVVARYQDSLEETPTPEEVNAIVSLVRHCTKKKIIIYAVLSDRSACR